MNSIRTAAQPDSTISAWLMNAASKTKQGPKQLLVIQVLAAKPRYSSRASIQELALLCGTDPSTVTRAARTLGFDGWAALRSEIRVRLHSETPASHCVQV